MKNYLFLISVLLVAACGEKPDGSIDFLEPQPAGVKDETAFNKKYQGSYFSAAENAFLEIQSAYMIRREYIPIVFLRKELDSSFTADNTNDNNIVASFKKDNIEVDSFAVDSIYAHYNGIDTLFDFNAKGNLCRYMKGDYFLSYSNETQDSWRVRRVHADASGLNFSYIMPSDSLMAVLDVKDKKSIEGDSITPKRYQINPDKKELKKLVKQDVFEEDAYWIRVK